MVLYIATAAPLCGNKRITTIMAAAITAMVLASPLYRTFQVNKFGSRKYNVLLNYFVVLEV